MNCNLDIPSCWTISPLDAPCRCPNPGDPDHPSCLARARVAEFVNELVRVVATPCWNAGSGVRALIVQGELGITVLGWARRQMWRPCELAAATCAIRYQTLWRRCDTTAGQQCATPFETTRLRCCTGRSAMIRHTDGNPRTEAAARRCSLVRHSPCCRRCNETFRRADRRMLPMSRTSGGASLV